MSAASGPLPSEVREFLNNPSTAETVKAVFNDLWNNAETQTELELALTKAQEYQSELDDPASPLAQRLYANKLEAMEIVAEEELEDEEYEQQRSQQRKEQVLEVATIAIAWEDRGKIEAYVKEHDPKLASEIEKIADWLGDDSTLEATAEAAPAPEVPFLEATDAFSEDKPLDDDAGLADDSGIAPEPPASGAEEDMIDGFTGGSPAAEMTPELADETLAPTPRPTLEQKQEEQEAFGQQEASVDSPIKQEEAVNNEMYVTGDNQNGNIGDSPSLGSHTGQVEDNPDATSSQTNDGLASVNDGTDKPDAAEALSPLTPPNAREPHPTASSDDASLTPSTSGKAALEDDQIKSPYEISSSPTPPLGGSSSSGG